MVGAFQTRKGWEKVAGQESSRNEASGSPNAGQSRIQAEPRRLLTSLGQGHPRNLELSL